MSAGGGQTEKNVSGWTVDTLKEHVESTMLANDRRYEQRFIAQEKAIFEALTSSDKRFEQRFQAQEKATATADVVLKEWRVASNEWRDSMNDRERNFFPKAMGNVAIAVATISALIAIISPLMK